MSLPTVVKTSAAAATAVAGSLAAGSDSSWYRSLDKPRWQPPPAAFPVVWTGLYGLLAVAGARVLDRATGASRARFAWIFGTNLVLNAGWTWVFFGARAPRAALAEVAVLNVSNVFLLRRAWRADPAAAAALAPYAAWTAFATALTASIVVRNPGA